jgi:hypothetical protein
MESIRLGKLRLNTDERGNLFIYVWNDEKTAWDRMRDSDTEKVTEYLKGIYEALQQIGE